MIADSDEFAITSQQKANKDTLFEITCVLVILPYKFRDFRTDSIYSSNLLQLLKTKRHILSGDLCQLSQID